MTSWSSRTSSRWCVKQGRFGLQSTARHTAIPQLPAAHYNVTVDERQFFTEKPEQRPARYQCPRCRRTNDYSIRWMRRIKKASVPPGANERDKAIFAKSKDYLIRIDDDVTCKTCGKRFEIPSQRGLILLEELEGLPQEDYDE